MALANGPRTQAASNTTPSLSAARNLAFHSYGLMAVMTSPVLDTSSLDLKASAFAPADGMAVDTEANG
jgi:bromodomain-containing factor 1